MPQEVVLQRAQKKVKKLKSNNDCSRRRSGADRDTTQRSQPGRPQSGVWGQIWETLGGIPAPACRLFAQITS